MNLFFNNQFPSNCHLRMDFCLFSIQKCRYFWIRRFLHGWPKLNSLTDCWDNYYDQPIHRANCWTKTVKAIMRGMEVMAWEVTACNCNCRIGSHFFTKNILNTVLIRFQISLKFVMIQLQNELFQSCLLLPI